MIRILFQPQVVFDEGKDILTLSNGGRKFVFQTGSGESALISGIRDKKFLLTMCTFHSLALQARYFIHLLTEVNFFSFAIENEAGEELYNYLPDITSPFGSVVSISRLMVGPFHENLSFRLSVNAYFRPTSRGVLIRDAGGHGSVLICSDSFIRQYNLLDKDSLHRLLSQKEHCLRALVLILVHTGILCRDPTNESKYGLQFEEQVFHQWTRSAVVTRGYGRKDYEGDYAFSWKERSGIKLPGNFISCSGPLGGSFAEVISKRKSTVRPTAAPFSLEELSLFLWYLTHNEKESHRRRPYPSAGGLYGVHMFITGKLSEPSKTTLYRYCPEQHSLFIQEGKEGFLQDIHSNARFYAGAAPEDGYPLIVLLVVDIRKYHFYYDRVGYPSAVKEVGAILELGSLIAASMEIGFCPIGAGPGYLDDPAGEYYLPVIGEFMLSKQNLCP